MKQVKQSYNLLEKVFFSNIFLVFIVVFLSLESQIKQGFPLNSFSFYGLVSCLTLLFYLYAYRVSPKLKSSDNPRTEFYIKYRKSIQVFAVFLGFSAIIFSLNLLSKIISNIHLISYRVYLILFLSTILALAYYNNRFGISLRKITWLKPFLIGWTWAISTVLLPLFFLILETGNDYKIDSKFYFLFIQTFMYCSVNAILFDLKDFEDDTNRKLKTFVVKYGYHFTLYYIILPLLFLGFLSFLIFGIWYGLPLHRIIFMLIPILLLAVFTFLLRKPKPILFYLIFIDGMVFLKAVFGILSVVLFE